MFGSFSSHHWSHLLWHQYLPTILQGWTASWVEVPVWVLLRWCRWTGWTVTHFIYLSEVCVCVWHERVRPLDGGNSLGHSNWMTINTTHYTTLHNTVLQNTTLYYTLHNATHYTTHYTIHYTMLHNTLDYTTHCSILHYTPHTLSPTRCHSHYTTHNILHTTQYTLHCTHTH